MNGREGKKEVRKKVINDEVDIRIEKKDEIVIRKEKIEKEGEKKEVKKMVEIVLIMKEKWKREESRREKKKKIGKESEKRFNRLEKKGKKRKKRKIVIGKRGVEKMGWKKECWVSLKEMDKIEKKEGEVNEIWIDKKIKLEILNRKKRIMRNEEEKDLEMIEGEIGDEIGLVGKSMDMVFKWIKRNERKKRNDKIKKMKVMKWKIEDNEERKVWNKGLKDDKLMRWFKVIKRS